MIPVVLYYHQVVRQPRPDHYLLQSASTLEQFRRAMLVIKEQWRPLAVDEFAWTYRNGRRWPKRAVLVTFDDGFKNNLWAAEVLRELEINAVFFVISGVVGTRFQPWYVRFAELISRRRRDACACSWGAVDFRNEFSRRRWLKQTKEHLLASRPPAREESLQEIAEALGAAERDQQDPDLEFFGTEDVRRLVSLGMTVAAHSRTHDNLTACSPRERQDEIVDSAAELEQHAGAPVRYFSYPDGRFDDGVVEMARGRFDAAFTTEMRYTAPDLWRYPRRAADGYGDVRVVLNPWFPAKRNAVDAVKRVLRF
jgi:peptidoglycan/xylan/chitin deacetylase (PgdA/CDA1 family)